MATQHASPATAAAPKLQRHPMAAMSGAASNGATADPN